MFLNIVQWLYVQVLNSQGYFVVNMDLVMSGCILVLVSLFMVLVKNILKFVARKLKKKFNMIKLKRTCNIILKKHKWFIIHLLIIFFHRIKKLTLKKQWERLIKSSTPVLLCQSPCT